jgi:hypothetical protein
MPARPPSPPPGDHRARILALVEELLDALLPAPAEPAPPSPALSSPPPPLVDKRELARALAVSVATIDRLDREGQPHVRIGDAKRYDVAAVLAWHRERSARADAPEAGPIALSGVKLLSRRRASDRR